MASLDSLPPEYVKADNGPRVIAVTSVMLVLTVILFGLRLYARRLAQGNRGWDDHVLIPAFVLMIGTYICVYCQVIYGGIGRHMAVLLAKDPGMVKNYLILLYALEWCYVPSIMLSRMSVVILYLRIFTEKWPRIACWFVMAFLASYCTSTLIAAQVQCRPFNYIWDKNIEGGKCFDLILWYQLTNIPNIVADVMIMALPVRTIWSIKASRARKSGIAAVCLTGSIGLIASCARTSVFYLQKKTLQTDPTRADEAFSWTSVECGMYFSAACLIGMRPLLHHLPRWFKQRVGNTTHSPGATGYQGDTMKLKVYGKASQYASISNEDEVALRSYSRPDMAPAMADAHASASARASNGHNHEHYNANSNNIRIETNIEIRHGDRDSEKSAHRNFDKNYP